MKTIGLTITFAVLLGFGQALMASSPGGVGLGEKKDRKQHVKQSQTSGTTNAIQAAESAAMEAHQATAADLAVVILDFPTKNQEKLSREPAKTNNQAGSEAASSIEMSIRQEARDARLIVKAAFHARKDSILARFEALNNKDENKAPSTGGILLAMLAFMMFIPPVTVGMKKGLSSDFYISLLLTATFWVPGLIHAIFISAK